MGHESSFLSAELRERSVTTLLLSDLLQDLKCRRLLAVIDELDIPFRRYFSSVCAISSSLSKALARGHRK